MGCAKYELRRVWTESSENAVEKIRKSSVYIIGNIKRPTIYLLRGGVGDFWSSRIFFF